MANRVFESSSHCLKAATVILLIALIVHVIGFSIPRWATAEFEITGRSLGTEAGYHAGLWQHCSCANVFDSGVCLCFSRTNDPGWYKLVQAAEVLGLIGLIISLFLSLVLMCYKQNKTYKLINLLLVSVSGGVILIGVIVFGIKTKETFDALGNIPESLETRVNIGHRHLGYAFILCIVAGCVCILVCAPLFMIDLRSNIPDTSREPPVHYTAQGQIFTPPQGYEQGRQPPVGYMPQQPQYGAPPAYQPYYQPDNSGIPYKA